MLGEEGACKHGATSTISVQSSKLLGMFLFSSQNVRIAQGFKEMHRIKAILAACPQLVKRKTSKVLQSFAMTTFLAGDYEKARELYFRSQIIHGCATHTPEVFFAQLEQPQSQIFSSFAREVQECRSPDVSEEDMHVNHFKLLAFCIGPDGMLPREGDVHVLYETIVSNPCGTLQI